MSSSEIDAHPFPVIPDAEAGVARTTLLRKLKASFLLISLLAVIAVHIPALPLGVQAFGHAFGNVVGQEHRWNMFSADPRGTSLDLWAEIVRTDGQVEEWRIEQMRFGGDLAYYHWVKWMETAVLDPEHAQLDGFARWLASQSLEPIREIVVYGRLGIAGEFDEPQPPAEVIVVGRFAPGGNQWAD